jgi:hypothetical protein
MKKCIAYPLVNFLCIFPIVITANTFPEQHKVTPQKTQRKKNGVKLDQQKKQQLEKKSMDVKKCLQAKNLIQNIN